MTIPSASSIAVVGATNASPIVVQTSPPHGLLTGAIVSIGGVSGNAAANVSSNAITVVDSTHFSLNGTTGSGAYAGGGGVWPQGKEVFSVNLSQIDAQLYTRALDKTGDVASGVLSLSSNATANAPGAGLLANAPGAVIKTTSGARFSHGDGDDVVLNARTRSITISCAEYFGEYASAIGPNATYAQVTATASPSGGLLLGVASLNYASPYTFWMPLTRLHDRAVLLRATLYFWPQMVNPVIAQLPTAFPSFEVLRMNPTFDSSLASLSGSGASVFKAAVTPASYAKTSAVGASGAATLATALSGASSSISAGQLLKDASGNSFQVTTSATYASGAAIPIAFVPPTSGVFSGAGTNHSPGDPLSWSPSPPAGASSNAVVAAGGLTGGLNAGYAQSIVFTPDSAFSTIDQSTYAYVARWVDDSTAGAGGGWNSTIYSAIKLDFAGIAAMTPQ